MKFAGFRVVRRLVIAHALAHPGRLLFTALSTTLAAAVVVWVVSGYDSLVDKFDDFAEGYLGRYQLVLVPAAKTTQFGGMGAPDDRALPAALLARLAKDPDVATVEPVFQARARIENPQQTPEERAGRARQLGGNGSGRRRGGAGAGTTASRDADDERPAAGNPVGVTSSPPGGAANPPGAANPLGGNGNPLPANPTPAEAAAMMARFSRQPTLVGTPAVDSPHPLIEGRWLDVAHPEALEGVLTRSSAELLDVKLGDEVTVARGMGMGGAPGLAGDVEPLRIKLVGIAEQPKTLPPPKFMIGLPPTRDAALRRGPASSALYVSKQVAEQVVGRSIASSYAGLVLKPGADPRAVQARWITDLAAAQPATELQSLADVESEIDSSTTAEVVRTQALSATGIALLAALFIIFTTLSMGVHERSRQFAVLRAVALSKSHITAMILIESLVLGLIGWGGGLLAGWGMLTAMQRLRPDVTAETASLGWWCVVLSGACALGGALAAAIAPAWQATRVRPLDAMAPRRRLQVGKLSGWATVVGLALIALNPLLVFYVPMPDTARYMWSAALGCTGMAVGFVLLTPLTVLACERLLARPVAGLLGIPYRLLATQLSTNLWRTVGTSVALTLGLGLFVAMQTWGYSMLGPFTPGTWVPDMLVIMQPMGVPDSELDAVKHVPGVVAEQCLPLAVKQVKLAGDVTGFDVRASATRQDTCVMVGVDPQLAIGGSKPLFPFQFVAGSSKEAAAKLKQGRYCVVPDHFARESGLAVGDKFAVSAPASEGPTGRGRRRRGMAPPEQADKTAAATNAPDSSAAASSASAGESKDENKPDAAPVAPEQPAENAEPAAPLIEYEIAGIVSMPGWHWMSKQGFRQGRAAGLMFADFDQVRRDFALDRTRMFWMNCDKQADEAKMQAGMQAIADRNFDARSPLARQGGLGQMPERRGGRGREAGANVTLKSADSVRQQITARADGIIWALSQLPLITLAVTSLGVMNTVLASIRARRWDLGVLRALGVTRFTLFRLIIAEALLVGVVACILSLGFGTMAGYCGTGVTRYINIRGGMVTPLIVPWAKLMFGFAATLGLCLLAALWPAISTGRTEVLRLLQAGRASM